MRHRFPFLIGLLALIAAVAPTTASARSDRDPGPVLQTQLAALQQALKCTGDLRGPHSPVLLVHGTFADSDINWSWNYVETLPTTGRDVCTVDLPDRSAGDAQVSSEYVVYAIRAIAKQSRGEVDVIGHSQGGLQARWALRWWPDIRHLVSDVVMFGTPNHGSAFPDAVCTGPFFCAASLYQMRTGSAFLTALNKPRETVGNVSYTSINTADDQTFVLPSQSALNGKPNWVTNVLVQDVCPGHPVDHVSLAFDGPAYALALDALDHRGPADPSRVDPAVCQTDTMPGVTRDEANLRLLEYAGTLQELLGPNGPKAQGEPALADYTARGGRRGEDDDDD
jgi:triacylglycerol esterase/lipase EstA (alpha/beta hydrolase family)